jgi:hypothetical protein
MAQTEYQVLCRFINTVSQRAITNKSKDKWISVFGFDEDHHIPANIAWTGNNPEVTEFMNEASTREHETKLQGLIIEGNKITNSKYDMLYVYAGCDIYYPKDDKSYPYVLKDKYERILTRPWFVYCTCGSLNAAMERVKTLINKVGIENVQICKCVPLDQFPKLV